eukprot:COSAG05_NODE_522_length_9020_cov_18.531891_3_plen_194_part_00
MTWVVNQGSTLQLWARQLARRAGKEIQSCHAGPIQRREQSAAAQMRLLASKSARARSVAGTRNGTQRDHHRLHQKGHAATRRSRKTSVVSVGATVPAVQIARGRRTGLRRKITAECAILTQRMIARRIGEWVVCARSPLPRTLLSIVLTLSLCPSSLQQGCMGWSAQDASLRLRRRGQLQGLRRCRWWRCTAR